jgi:hypothetical protein
VSAVIRTFPAISWFTRSKRSVILLVIARTRYKQTFHVRDNTINDTTGTGCSTINILRITSDMCGQCTFVNWDIYSTEYLGASVGFVRRWLLDWTVSDVLFVCLQLLLFVLSFCIITRSFCNFSSNNSSGGSGDGGGGNGMRFEVFTAFLLKVSYCRDIGYWKVSGNRRM